MAVRYRLDPAQGRFTVQGFARGLLSAFAHNPTFAVRDFSGEISLDPATLEHASIQMTIRAGSLELLDQVSPADRRDIEGRMRQEVLEITTYPEIRYDANDIAAEPIAPNDYCVRINGRLVLHGVVNPCPIGAQMRVYNDGVRLMARGPLSLSEYRIRPVAALAGAIKLEDQLHVEFDLVAWKEMEPTGERSAVADEAPAD
jgi:polyisoprenoid-binding protein YceI